MENVFGGSQGNPQTSTAFPLTNITAETGMKYLQLHWGKRFNVYSLFSGSDGLGFMP